MKVDLIDIGIGNIGSVKRCLKNLDIEPYTVDALNQPDGSRPLILPGVGQFSAVMQALKQNGLDDRLSSLILNGTPYLGICIGLHVLFDGSEEASDTAGLGLIKGDIVRFQKGKVPQIGWNIVRGTSRQLVQETQGDRQEERQYAYFVNSYYASPISKTIVSHTANYFGEFCAAIKSENITAVQFHPEKSAQFGMQFLKEWWRDVD